jgi:hyaluronoglucosaminidase
MISNLLEKFSYGAIEGFFGRTWSWETRADYASFLKQYNYQFYIYAPKADRYLRRLWMEPWPTADYEALQKLGSVYSDAGLAWGIGLTPFEIHFNYDSTTIEKLNAKIDLINKLKPDILAILFDDMRGNFEEIAKIQADVTKRIVDRSNATSFIMCPTYYSDAAVLDKIFGQRPANYLETLGKLLDPAVHVFWTGPEVCSTSYPEAHLKSVAEKLGRKPFIWDNYPVNDGARICPFLHLRAFQNRPHTMADLTAGHAVNPMNQAYASQIPMATLDLSYRQQSEYHPDVAFALVSRSLCGDPLAAALQMDLANFQDLGLNGMNAELKAELIEKYSVFDDRVSHEIIDWLKGEYPFDPACLTD